MIIAAIVLAAAVAVFLLEYAFAQIHCAGVFLR